MLLVMVFLRGVNSCSVCYAVYRTSPRLVSRPKRPAAPGSVKWPLASSRHTRWICPLPRAPPRLQEGAVVVWLFRPPS